MSERDRLLDLLVGHPEIRQILDDWRVERDNTLFSKDHRQRCCEHFRDRGHAHEHLGSHRFDAVDIGNAPCVD